jgi:hypothetical protein
MVKTQTDRATLIGGDSLVPVGTCGLQCILTDVKFYLLQNGVVVLFSYAGTQGNSEVG